jgi:phage shock protein C
MNKVININLGGLPFVADDSAYEALAAYVAGLRQHFAASEGCDEIVADIEARLAELFADYLKGRQILTLADVKRAISVMGIPTEIDGNAADQSANENAQGGANGGAGNPKWQSGKRLFRSIDDKIVGGVCSGLSTYLGISDPIWIRLAMVASVLLGFGFGIPLYFILLIIIPKAMTAADKLAMRGEPVNVNNIARTVEDGMGSLKDKLTELGGDINESVTGGAKKFRAGGAYAAGAASRNSDAIADVFKAILKIVLFGAAALAIVVLAVTWIGFFVGGIWVQPYWTYFLDSAATGTIGWVAIMLLITLPIAGLVLACARLIYKFETPRIASLGMSLTWLGALCTLIVITVSVVRQHASANSTQREITLNKPEGDLLQLQFDDRTDNTNGTLQMGDVYLMGDQLKSENIELNIEPSDDIQFHLIQKNTAWSKTASDAYHAADEISYSVVQTDSSLRFPASFSLPKGNKWNNQTVQFTLKVPIGKRINIFPAHIHNFANHIFLAKDRDEDQDWENHYDVFTEKNRIWRMTQRGLVCENCTALDLNGGNTPYEDTPDEPDTPDAPDAPDAPKNENFNGSINIDRNGIRIKSDSGEVKIKIDRNGLDVRRNGEHTTL